MAITYVGGDSQSDASGGDLTLTQPTHATDDIGIVFDFSDKNTTTLSISAGWTELDQSSTAAGRNRTTAVWWKRYTSAAESNPVASSSVIERHSAILAVFRGVDTTTAFDATIVGVVQASAAWNDANPAITTATDNAAVVLLSGVSFGDLTAWGAPSGYTMGSSAVFSFANAGLAYDLDVGAAGTETPGVWTNTSTSGDTSKYTLALRPAGGGGATITAAPIASGSSTTQPSLSVGAVDISVTPITSGSSTTQPALAPGSVDISPTPLASGSSTTQPSLSGGAATISPSPLVGDAAVTTPSLTPGGVVASPNPITSGHLLTQPVVSLDTTQVVSPTPIGSSSQVTNPAASPGAVVIGPTPIVTGSALTEPTLLALGGTQLIYPAEIVSGSSLTDPLVIPNQAISPDPIPSGAVLIEPHAAVNQIIELTAIPSGHEIEWTDFFWIRNALVPTHPVNPIRVSGLKRGRRIFHE